MKKFAFLAALLLCLAGCSSAKETTTVCNGTSSGLSDNMTLIATGDKVTSATEEVIIPFADYQVETDEDKALFEEMMLAQFSAMSSTDGIDVTSEATETELIVRVSIDMTKVDYSTLVSLGFAEESEDNINTISLEVTVEGFEASGFTCETK